jgi:hypothetical protein
VLWQAEDRFFTPRKPNLNLRTILPAIASANVEVIFDVGVSKVSKDTRARRADQTEIPLSVAK